MVNIALFASGNGSNAENIVSYFADSKKIRVGLIASDRETAFVLIRADRLGIDKLVFNKGQLQEKNFGDNLRNAGIDYIILAGFLLKIPDHLIAQYEDRIINIHPALLPAYGGKGMYGNRVHQAVIKNGDKVSGITVHLVNERYDEGRILFQQSIDVLATDSPESLAEKIHEIEYQFYPKIIEEYIQKERS